MLAALEEVLVLPTRHADLVAQAPLRLRSGVLLYGPPGCGKTHVAAAAAAATGMRFISVKGVHGFACIASISLPRLCSRDFVATDEAVHNGGE